MEALPVKSGVTEKCKVCENSPLYIPFTYTKYHFNTPGDLEVMACLMNSLTPGIVAFIFSKILD